MSLLTDLIELMQLAEGGISEYDGVHSQADQATDRALVQRVRRALLTDGNPFRVAIPPELKLLEERLDYK